MLPQVQVDRSREGIAPVDPLVLPNERPGLSLGVEPVESARVPHPPRPVGHFPYNHDALLSVMPLRAVSSEPFDGHGMHRFRSGRPSCAARLTPVALMPGAREAAGSQSKSTVLVRPGGGRQRRSVLFDATRLRLGCGLWCIQLRWGALSPPNCNELPVNRSEHYTALGVAPRPQSRSCGYTRAGFWGQRAPYVGERCPGSLALDV